MRVGFNLLVLGGHIGEEHLPHLERIAALGYDGVEVPVFGGDLAHYRRMAARLDALGLARTASTAIADPALNPLSADASARSGALDYLKGIVDRAAALGATALVGPIYAPIGHFTGDGPTEAELAHGADNQRAAAAHAEPAGVRLVAEPLNRFECYALNTLEQASSFVGRVGHANYIAMYDTFHANIEERDPVDVIGRHIDAIGHIHISENDRGIPGRGHVPWPETFRAIRETGYDGWLTVEAFGRSVPELAAATRVWRDLFPDLPTLFAESLAHIRAGWEKAA